MERFADTAEHFFRITQKASSRSSLASLTVKLEPTPLMLSVVFVLWARPPLFLCCNGGRLNLIWATINSRLILLVQLYSMWWKASQAEHSAEKNNIHGRVSMAEALVLQEGAAFKILDTWHLFSEEMIKDQTVDICCHHTSHWDCFHLAYCVRNPVVLVNKAVTSNPALGLHL